MKYNRIPNTDLSLSTISLGTWVFGGDMWNGAKEAESLEAVEAALQLGVNLIDTAPIYGSGLSEEIVGKAIKGKRSDVILATKCGLAKKGKDISVNLRPESILKEIDDSLERLQVDYIDLYQCHWPDPHTPIEKTLETLLKLKQQKKIRYIGVSNFGLELLKKAVAFTPIATLQVQYSILERSIEKDILPFCHEKGIGVITYGSLGGGILSGKYKSPKVFDYGDARGFFYKYYSGQAFQRVQALIEHLKSIDKPLSQTVINWVRQQPGITSVIVGCRNEEQARSNVLTSDWDLTQEQLDEIQSFISKIPNA